MGENNTRTWRPARDLCKSQGGNLVTINTKKETQFIARYLARNDVTQARESHARQNGPLWAKVGQIGPKCDKYGTFFRSDFSNAKTY